MSTKAVTVNVDLTCGGGGIRAARFPAHKRLEDFDDDHALV